MAVQLDQIRSTAERVAASHHLEVVEVQFSGGAKFRTLQVFIEKDAATRAELAARAASGEAPEVLAALPSGVPVERLSGVTHEDCEIFTRDFGTLLDIEDLIPGAEYTLEVSSPGLERKLSRPEDFARFTGSLIKLQTFTPVTLNGGSNRHWQGRLTGFTEGVLTIDLSALKQKGKAKKATSKSATEQVVAIPFANVEKANLVAEI
jgi:ribosome maturation factor RimP